VAACYGFIHALYQEVVYTRVPPGRRVRLHRQIGERLEAGYGEQASTIASELAMHFEQGQDYPRAVQYWRQAGSRAAARSAYHEAASCYEQAVAVLAHLHESRDTLEQGIDLRLDWRSALHPLGEQGRIGGILLEAEDLAKRLGDEQRLGQIACYLCIHLLNIDEYDRAITTGHRALALGTTSDAFDVQVVAQAYLGTAYYRVGDFRQALDFSRRVTGLLTGEERFSHFGQVAPPAVTAYGLMVWSLAELGGFAEGYNVGDEAIRLAEAIEQPYSVAFALSCVGLLSCRQGTRHTAIPALERGVSLCKTANIPPHFPQAASILGAIYAQAGRVAETLPLLDQVLDRVASGSRMLNLGPVLTDLSETLLLVGRVDEASLIAERLLKLSRTGSSYQAHAYRFLGEVAMRRDSPDIDQAANHYQQALALANELGMRPLQAHCHRGLGTLYRQTEQPEQARAELSTAIDIYRDMEMTFFLSQAEVAFTLVL
jgi:tetratricopeptide (TPR) repeat protein